ncbi:AimR family lysis-lysogeny pheromone receptor [Priestia megaterium]|uniref:AimR family lysis-lysogeny pheromone receptor n=1 Tax=Priestia megaterium TaxID=1404 RepID=UPI002D7F96AC|nr:AimR family lysis-lysogeny pheromone receptor [Priestia megaterium]MEB4860622.1 AimR family lysis-lysogeny pheromone receptor [Priestia megaterium]
MRATLKNEMKKHTQHVIADKIGTTSPTITKFLNGTIETSLDTSLKLIKFLAEKKEKKFMLELIKEIEKPSNVIIALEYCSTNRLIKAMNYLLKKFNDTSNHELKEYLGIYELIYNWQLRHDGTPVDEQIKKARQLKVTTDDGNVLIKMLEVYGYFSKGKYNLAYDLATDLQPLVEELESGYIKKSVSARLAETRAFLALNVMNDVEQAKECATYVIKSKIGRSFSAFAHFVLGEVHRYSDFEMSKLHFEKAIKVYSKYSKVNAEETRIEIEYLSAIHGEGYSYTNEICEAMYLYNTQNQAQAIELVKNNKPSTAMEMMFVGQMQQDEQMLIQSFTGFIQSKDMFNANHVKELLKDYNTNSMILDNLMNIFA